MQQTFQGILGSCDEASQAWEFAARKLIAMFIATATVGTARRRLTSFGIRNPCTGKGIAMSHTELETMTNQLLALPPSERLLLGERLVESVDCFASPEIAESWSSEIANRLAEYESGQVAGIPSAQVHEEVRRRMRS